MAVVESKRNQSNVREKSLEEQLKFQKRLNHITNRIHSAKDTDDILLNLQGEILSLFDADRITIYVVDGAKRQIYSRFKTGDEVNEIRVTINNESISGYCASSGKLLNISNAYDDHELKRINPELKFDKSWDEKTGFKTRQVLAYPIIFKNYILGVIQLINRRKGNAFIKIDELALKEVAYILGIALFNQKKIARSKRPRKFDFLIENNFLTQPELDQAITDARKTNQTLENVFMSEYEIPKKYIMAALGKFFRVETTEFNQNMPIPGQLMAGLKIPFLRNENRESAKLLIFH